MKGGLRDRQAVGRFSTSAVCESLSTPPPTPLSPQLFVAFRKPDGRARARFRERERRGADARARARAHAASLCGCLPPFFFMSDRDAVAKTRKHGAKPNGRAAPSAPPETRGWGEGREGEAKDSVRALLSDREATRPLSPSFSPSCTPPAHQIHTEPAERLATNRRRCAKKHRQAVMRGALLAQLVRIGRGPPPSPAATRRCARVPGAAAPRLLFCRCC